MTSIPLLPPLLSEVMIDFDQADYTMSEGETVVANVQVMSEVILDRDITVTVQTGGGTVTAGMVVHVLL